MRVAHASRVLVWAFTPKQSFLRRVHRRCARFCFERPTSEKVRDGGTPSSTRGTRALPQRSQADIDNADQRHSRRKTCQNKFLSMLQHFSEDRVRGQVEKSTAYVCH